ncbi:GSCOCG00000923001-RA-CDS [Cotesia congregata]|nr:GSCOCG00000923001-RA-CDS [Cotesia congregata]
MANPGGFLAHLIKLVTTIICLRYVNDKNSIMIVRAFQIFLIHSILGMFRFGSTANLIGKRSFREFYDRMSNIVEIIPFAFFSTEISRLSNVDELLRHSLLLVLILLPITHEIMPRKERPKLRVLINHSINLQLLIVTIACLQRGTFGVISFVLSYIFNRYYTEYFCDLFDVPYEDLIQYSLCFVEIFSLTAIQEL